MKNGLIAIVMMLLLVSCNNGWHYEMDIEAHSSLEGSEKVKLYSKTIDGTVVFQIKTKKGDILSVSLNPFFGDECFSTAQYKYRSTRSFNYYYFNIPGEDVQKEFEIIKAKKWQFLDAIRVATQTEKDIRANLYWRNYDQKFMIVPCGRWAAYTTIKGESRFVEPENRREIIVEEYYHFLSPYHYTHKAGEFSLNIY